MTQSNGYLKVRVLDPLTAYQVKDQPGVQPTAFVADSLLVRGAAATTWTALAETAAAAGFALQVDERDEGVRKVRSAFAVLQAFSDAGLTVTAGLSGNIGQVALALGHAGHYSVGIGMRERVYAVHGVMDVRSSVGGGTVVAITLPLKVPATVSTIPTV